MQAMAGLPDGEYDWTGRIIDGEYEWTGVKLIKENGEVRNAGVAADQEGAISSSVWPIKQGVYNLINKVGLSLKDAFRLGSLNPAIAARLDDELGSLRPGKRADLILIDEELNLYMTMVGGRIIHETDVIAELSY